MPIAPYPDGTYPTCERHGEHAGICWPCADERGREANSRERESERLYHVTCYEGRHGACDGSTSAPGGGTVRCACRCHAGTPPAVGVTVADLEHLRATLAEADEKRYAVFTDLLPHRDRETLLALVEDYARTFLGGQR
ncbi:MAG: hypothetical protein Q8S13_05950 [Dehalococcoidia bacterium]|nr:hypothetical protein [Dehalococcoidia bacterium]